MAASLNYLKIAAAGLLCASVLPSLAAAQSTSKTRSFTVNGNVPALCLAPSAPEAQTETPAPIIAAPVIPTGPVPNIPPSKPNEQVASPTPIADQPRVATPQVEKPIPSQVSARKSPTPNIAAPQLNTKPSLPPAAVREPSVAPAHAAEKPTFAPILTPPPPEPVVVVTVTRTPPIAPRCTPDLSSDSGSVSLA